jgi:hypothetical protein
VEVGLCALKSEAGTIFRSANWAAMSLIQVSLLWWNLHKQVSLITYIKLALMFRVFKFVCTVTQAVQRNQTNRTSTTNTAGLWLYLFLFKILFQLVDANYANCSFQKKKS